MKKEELSVSYNVVSLFTKTPIKETGRNQPQSRQHRGAMKLVLETTCFIFGEIYKQKFGVAMGSPVSPIVVHVYMGDLEQKIIAR